mgnify:CR=1 FL=1
MREITIGNFKAKISFKIPLNQRTSEIEKNLEMWAHFQTWKKEKKEETWTVLSVIPGYRFKNLQIEKISLDDNVSKDSIESDINFTFDCYENIPYTL